MRETISIKYELHEQAMVLSISLVGVDHKVD